MKLKYRVTLISLLLVFLMLGSIAQANSRSNPAYINEPVSLQMKNRSIELKLLDAVRNIESGGYRTLSSIPEGYEVMLLNFWINVEQSEDELFSGFDLSFEVVNGDGRVENKRAYIETEEPLLFDFYGSREFSGWVGLLVSLEDPNPQVVYNRGTRGEAWFSPTKRHHVVLNGLAWGDPIDALGEVRFISDHEGWIRYEKVNETLTEIGPVEIAGVRYIIESDKLVGINALIGSEDAAFMSMVFTALYGPWYMTDFGLTWESEEDNMFVQIRNDEIFGTFISLLDLEAAIEKFLHEE